MSSANDYQGMSDNDRIDAAIANRNGDIVVIPPRQSDSEPERTWWLLDRAILLPANTTVILQNCRIKLSDCCRDNFFRSANCGIGLEDPELLSNIHIKGIGNAVLEGADHPRSTGDSSKIMACPCPKNFTGAAVPTFNDLHLHSYGTDAGKTGENQKGDWRNIGILMANVEHLSIENIRIVESHAWAISLENCAYASINHIDFHARMTREIDGMKQNVENQDGINLRNGCHDVIISDITGTTGDDVVALTCLASCFTPHNAGSLASTHVLSNDFTKREKGIRNIIVRNILASPAGGCLMVRLLASDGAEIRNVTVDGLVDTSPDDFHCHAALQVGMSPGLVGEPCHPYGTVAEQCITKLTVSNVISNAREAIQICGGLTDAVITNVMNRNPDGKALGIRRPELIKNVQFSNVLFS